MRKTLLTLFCAFTTLMLGAQTAKTYSDNLIVTFDGNVSSQNENMIVTTNSDGTVTLALYNFVLGSTPVGNIVLENISLVSGEKFSTFVFDSSIAISAGNLDGISGWYGPSLGLVPVVATGQINEDDVYVNYSLDLTSALGQIVYLVFGEKLNTMVFTDNLVVTINDVSTAPQKTTILYTENGDGTCDFALNNFVLNLEGEQMGVGNIALTGLDLVRGQSFNTFSFVDNLEITAGNLEGIDTWIGPILGEIPLNLSGKVSAAKLFVTIDIDMMSSLGQIVKVKFGTDDFETSIGQVSVLSKPNVMYDLQGRCVKEMRKGLYIKGGKVLLRK